MTHPLISLIVAAIGLFSGIIPRPCSVLADGGSYTHPAGVPFVYETDSDLPREGYRLEIDSTGVRIFSSDEAGRRYALVSLAAINSLYPEELESSLWTCETGVVCDSPRYEWRGLMVDVSRHYRSLDFLYRHIDAMCAYKLNTLHMHLTDAGGWRMEIKAYPRLTELTAFRTGERYMDWWRDERTYGGEWGGYYTQDELRDLVRYAETKNVTIVPEIEFPGHNDETTVAYPFLSCDGTMCGDVCPGKETTFEFFEKVLDEVMDVFPSHYIHIGGDEAGKSRWKSCPDCRRRMHQLSINSVDKLQSYAVSRIAAYVQSKGRDVIGWDEILQGGLADGALVMSWRGTEGGKKAAAAGHKVVMTPGGYCYIDSAQDYPEKEPVAYGNYLPLSKVYSYNPSAGFRDSSYVLGVQANLWAEFVDTDSYAEYMYWPRALAMAEVGWTRPELKDYADFHRRALLACERMREKGYNVFDLSNEYGERKEALSPVDHLAKGVKPEFRGKCKWNKSYTAGGEGALTDGLCGGWTYKDGRWQGFLCDLDVVLDLGEETEMKHIEISALQNRNADVFLPAEVVYSVSSDGENWAELGRCTHDVPLTADGAKFRTFAWDGETGARYLRVQARRGKKGGFLFFDEIVIH